MRYKSVQIFVGARDREEEFVAFVVASSPRLLHVATLMVGDRHRAEDLVQAALEAAYRRWYSLGPQDPYAYVRRSILNANVSWWRRAANRDSLVADVPEIPVGDQTERIDQRAALRQALRLLTRRERQVVVLRYIEDLSEQQTAAELALPWAL